jgi:hypothetical protein
MHLVAGIGEHWAGFAESEPGFTKSTNKNWLDGICPSSQLSDLPVMTLEKRSG